MTNQIVQAASPPALAKNARTGHPRFRNGKGKRGKLGHPPNIVSTMSFGTHVYLLDHIAWTTATKDAAIKNIVTHEYPNVQLKAFHRNTQGGH